MGKKNRTLEDIHNANQYISNQGIIFSEHSKNNCLSKLADMIASENFQETVDWLNSITESKWNRLFESLKLLENEHKKNMQNITDLLGADKCVDASGALEAIAYLQKSLNSIGFMLLTGGAIAKNMQRMVAKQNRAKRKQQEDPNIEKARNRAKEIWAEYGSSSLLDTAYKIKDELNIRKSVGTVQEWIRDLNPNAKKKKTSK